MTETLKVLLVEDDEQDAELVRIELERGGFDLTWKRVETEEELRRALTEDVWDLIISDFAMPTFDGLRAFAVYREMDLDTPFIFVSGALGEERAVAAMRAGARDYILKGDLGRLTAAVRRELKEMENRQNLNDAEERAKHKQTLLEAALAATGAGLFEFSMPDRGDSFVSERWAEILGYTAVELSGKEELVSWHFDQIGLAENDPTRGLFTRLVSGESATLHTETQIRHKDGHWVAVSAYAIALERDSNGVATQVIAVMLDVSENKQLQKRYLQAQKMEAIGKLAGGIAHDFNNLLTAIISFAGFVRDDLPRADPRRDDIGEVLAAADRATALTRQLLLFSRQQPANLQPVNVVEAIKEIETLLRRTIGEDIKLQIRVPKTHLMIQADSGQLDQIVLNLAVNARDAMPDGGNLQISVGSCTLREEEAHVVDIDAGEYVEILVADTGHGIDELTLRRVFEPFFTTKGPQQGTGLGLATSYGIARQFGGVIDVESTVGVGSTFRVLLPGFSGDAQTLVKVEASTQELGGTETILVVEDEAGLQRLLQRALSGLGYKVLMAEDAIAGMALFEAHRDQIGMVFSDIVLPRGNGFELAEHVRNQDASLPILLTSGYTDHRAVREGTQFEILWKPYTPALLASRIRACLAPRGASLER